MVRLFAIATASALLMGGCAFDPSAQTNPGGDDPPGPGEPDADTVDGPVDGGGGGGADANTPDALPPDTEPAYSLRVNLSGVAHTGTDYPGTWLVDDGSYCGGNLWTSTGAIHNTVDDPLFQSNRYGSFTCGFGGGVLPSGDYTVTLLLGEVYRGAGCVNTGSTTRIFDVLMEGAKVLSDFDVMAANGGCVQSTTTSSPMPVTRSFTVNVTDGTLTVATQGATNGMISAIEIVSVATVVVSAL